MILGFIVTVQVAAPQGDVGVASGEAVRELVVRRPGGEAVAVRHQRRLAGRISPTGPAGGPFKVTARSFRGVVLGILACGCST